MSRSFVIALLLAHNVADALEIPGNFANHARQAATTDPAVTACSIAYAVVDSCFSASPGLTTAAESAVAACLCCHSTIEIDEFYSICADYISASFPQSSSQYSAFAGLADACATEMPSCGAGAGAGGGGTVPMTSTAPATASATQTGGGSGGGGSSATSMPDACISFDNIISSCIAATPSITGEPNWEAASCVCYTTVGGTSSFTTEIDDLASSCAPWAQTAADATAYSAIVAFENFCESYSPTPTPTRTTSAVSPQTHTGSSTSTARFPGFGGGSASSDSGSGSGSTTTSRTSSTTSSRSTTPTKNVAAPAGTAGWVVWGAEWFSLVLSFFLLI